MITKKPVFLGYTVFYMGEPFMCSLDSVTKNKVYLKVHALVKLNKLGKSFLKYHMWTPEAARIEHNFRKVRKLTLRRVYAH